MASLFVSLWWWQATIDTLNDCKITSSNLNNGDKLIHDNLNDDGKISSDGNNFIKWKITWTMMVAWIMALLKAMMAWLLQVRIIWKNEYYFFTQISVQKKSKWLT